MCMVPGSYCARMQSARGHRASPTVLLPHALKLGLACPCRALRAMGNDGKQLGWCKRVLSSLVCPQH